MPIHGKTFRTGASVPRNGLYNIFHTQHLLPVQVALSAADSPVTFLLQRDVPALDYINNLEIRVPLTELEPIEHDDSTIGVVSMDRDSA